MDLGWPGIEPWLLRVSLCSRGDQIRNERKRGREGGEENRLGICG
jgi:hypothetical protein